MEERYAHHLEGSQAGTNTPLLLLNWLDHLVDADIERMQANRMI